MIRTLIRYQKKAHEAACDFQLIFNDERSSPVQSHLAVMLIKINQNKGGCDDSDDALY